MRTAILKVSCPDREGLVAGVAAAIAQKHGNIVSLDQYSDPVTKMFFMRLEWTLDKFKLSTKELAALLKKLAQQYSFVGGYELFFSDRPLRLAIFVSQYDHCLREILLQHRAQELNAQIVAIVSNHLDSKALAREYAIPFLYTPTGNKGAAETKQLRALKKLRVDSIVLARYMQILSPAFVAAFSGRIINVHHSFLPAFVGAKPYQQAYDRGVKVIGATAHFVTSDLDEGPIIEQAVERISHKDSVASLTKRGRDIERRVLIRALESMLDHRLFVSGKRVVVF